MAINYPSQRTLGTIRASEILTTGYVVVKTWSTGDEQSMCNDSTHLVLFYDFTIGSLNHVEIKIEGSLDGTNWYQETSEAISAGVATVSLSYKKIAATGKGYISFPIISPYIRVSAKGDGTVTNSLLSLQAGFISKF